MTANMKQAPKIIMLGKAKGGSGSTTIGTALAVQMAKLGRRVAVVDLDDKAKATWALLQSRTPGFYNWFGVVPDDPEDFTPDWVRTRFQYFTLRARPDTELWVLPGNPMTGAAESVAQRMRWADTRLRDMLRMLTCYDYIIVDGPDYGDLARFGLLAADLVLAVSTLRSIDQDSVEILAELLNAVRPDNPPVWVAPNRNDGRSKSVCLPLLAELQTAVTQAQEAGMNWSVCPPIGEAIGLDKALGEGTTWPEMNPVHPVSKQIKALAAQLDAYFQGVKDESH